MKNSSSFSLHYYQPLPDNPVWASQIQLEPPSVHNPSLPIDGYYLTTMLAIQFKLRGLLLIFRKNPHISTGCTAPLDIYHSCLDVDYDSPAWKHVLLINERPPSLHVFGEKVEGYGTHIMGNGYQAVPHSTLRHIMYLIESSIYIY